jgi:hypothetical protein
MYPSSGGVLLVLAFSGTIIRIKRAGRLDSVPPARCRTKFSFTTISGAP